MNPLFMGLKYHHGQVLGMKSSISPFAFKVSMWSTP